MRDDVLACSWHHIDYRNLNHRIAAGLQTHRGAGHVHQHLTRQGGVVDAHIKLHALVLGLTRDSLAHQVDAMAHVADGINAVDGEHMSFIVSEIGVSLDVFGHLFEGADSSYPLPLHDWCAGPLLAANAAT